MAAVLPGLGSSWSEDAVSRAGQLVQRRGKYYEDCRLDRSRVSALVPLIFANPFLTASECSE